jgi:hypothetical protein
VYSSSLSPELRFPSFEMSFSAVTSFTGVPDFKVIDINPEEVAKALQIYLERGSKLTGVSLDDISTSVISLPSGISSVNLVELLNLGMKLFDAIVWLTAGRPTTHPLSVDPAMTKDSLPSLHEVARSVFYVYFFIITQARYPAGSKNKEKPRVPNFLKVIMGMDKDQHVYVDRICSFEPQKFDQSWVRYVNFKNFGQESISRFGLGVAGYRLFGPFKLYKVKEGLSNELKDAASFAQKVAVAPATWDVHPSTRNPSVLTKRGNLNKNLGNLILEVFTTEQIEEMVSTKILFATPQKEVSCRNYLQWSPEDDISGSSLIFRS